jgi:hypothetical protein
MIFRPGVVLITAAAVLHANPAGAAPADADPVGLVHPFVGTEVTSVDPNVYRSPYSHDDETAAPGCYRVGLSRYQTTAELSRPPAHVCGHRRGGCPVQRPHDLLAITLT